MSFKAFLIRTQACLKVIPLSMTTTEHIKKLSTSPCMKICAKLVDVMSKVILDMKNCVSSQMQFIRQHL